MPTQTRLPTSDRPRAFHLDPRSREAGRRGVAKARAALAETVARAHAARAAEAGHDHAHAA